MKIEIRTRRLRDGSRSIYLDFYADGKRWYEYLNLYLVPDGAPDAKRVNADAMAKAVEIKAKRTLGIEDEPSETDRDETPRCVFADWLDDHLAATGRNLRLADSTKANARTCANIVKSYLAHKRRPRLLMSKIDKRWVLGFLDYMKNEYRNTKSPGNPKPLSPRTLHLHERTLRSFLTRL